LEVGSLGPYARQDESFKQRAINSGNKKLIELWDKVKTEATTTKEASENPLRSAIDKLNENEYSEAFINAFSKVKEKSGASVSDKGVLELYELHSAMGKNPSEFMKLFTDYNATLGHYNNNIEKIYSHEIRQATDMIGNAESLGSLPGIGDLKALVENEGVDEFRNRFNEFGIDYLFPPRLLNGKTLAEASKEDLLGAFDKKLTKQDKKNICDAMAVESVEQIKKAGLSHGNESILKAIALTNKGIVIDSMNKGATKMNNLLQTVNDVASHKDIVENVSKACHTRGSNAYNSTKILELARGYASADKVQEFNAITGRMIANNKLDVEELSREFVHILGKECDLAPEEMQKLTPDVIQKWDLQNIPTFAIGLKQMPDENKLWLKDLFKTTVHDNYWEYITNPESKIGQTNAATAKEFKVHGLDYNEWLHSSLHKEFKYNKNNIEEQVEGIRSNLAEDLTSLSNNNVVGAELQRFMASKGYKIEDGTVKLNEKDLAKDELGNFVQDINKFMEKKWSQSGVADDENAITIQNHLGQRVKDINALKTINTDEVEDLSINLWKRQPGHDLFQGTYCQCCIALDGVNKKYAPESLVNTIAQIGEITNKNNETVGKVEMFWGKHADSGKPILVANSIEMATGYQNSKQVRSSIKEYMKDYSKSVSGRDDVELYAGQHFNDIPLSDLPKENVTLNVIGKATNNTYYFDSLKPGSWTEKLDSTHKAEFYKL
jgi:hypothetical protein